MITNKPEQENSEAGMANPLLDLLVIGLASDPLGRKVQLV